MTKEWSSIRTLSENEGTGQGAKGQSLETVIRARLVLSLVPFLMLLEGAAWRLTGSTFSVDVCELSVVSEDIFSHVVSTKNWRPLPVRVCVYVGCVGDGTDSLAGYAMTVFMNNIKLWGQELPLKSWNVNMLHCSQKSLCVIWCSLLSLPLYLVPFERGASFLRHVTRSHVPLQLSMGSML